MHEGLNDYALLLKISRDPPPRLRHIRPDLPRAFDEVINTALAMSPAARYPTAEAFAEALSNAARQAGIFTADARAVKAFVTPLLLPGLEARREAAARIRRQRLGGSTSDVERLSRPSAPRIESERPSGPGSQPYAPVPRVEIPRASAPRSSPLASAVTLTDAIGPSVREDSKEVTLSAGITPADTAPKPRSRAWLAVGAVLLVPLSGVVLTLARSSRSSSASNSAASPGAPPSAGSSVSAPILTPAELPVEPLDDQATDASTISPGELGLERGTTLGGRRHLRTPSSATSAYVQPEPRANPYKK
jgi:serine/threonine-protein kinase